MICRPSTKKGIGIYHAPYSKYPLFLRVFLGKSGFPWYIPPFLVEGRHDTNKQKWVLGVRGAQPTEASGTSWAKRGARSSSFSAAAWRRVFLATRFFRTVLEHSKGGRNADRTGISNTWVLRNSMDSFLAVTSYQASPNFCHHGRNPKKYEVRSLSRKEITKTSGLPLVSTSDLLN